MAEPNDAAVMLQDASEIVQEQYFDKYEEQYQDRFGSTTNKCFMPDPDVVTGDGKSMQYEVGPADTVRFQQNPLGDIASPQRIDPGRIKVRWNQQNYASGHDFTQVSARCQFDIYTIENGGAGTIVDLADRIYNSVQGDYDEKLAIMRHAGRTGQLALVNGTPKQNDRETYSAATATASNTAGMRIIVDNGSIAVFRPNARYDFINPSTGAVNAGNVRCTDIPNFDELSVGFEFMSTGITGEISTGNLANVSDNDIIVFSGTYNAGIYSFGAYFSAPSAGESFICGVDRTDAGYRWMIPQRISGGSGKITKALFDRMAIAMGFFGENPDMPVVWLSDPTQVQALRNEITEAAFIQFPVGDDRAKRFANFGSIGLNYQHPTYGTVKIMADPLANPTEFKVITNSTWKTLSYGWKGLKNLPGDRGHWYRLSQNTPNTGRGLIMAADWVGNICDWCTKPWKNGVIHTLAAA